jgi:hypothetical protein
MPIACGGVRVHSITTIASAGRDGGKAGAASPRARRLRFGRRVCPTRRRRVAGPLRGGAAPAVRQRRVGLRSPPASAGRAASTWASARGLAFASARGFRRGRYPPTRASARASCVAPRAAVTLEV